MAMASVRLVVPEGQLNYLTEQAFPVWRRCGNDCDKNEKGDIIANGDWGLFELRTPARLLSIRKLSVRYRTD